MRLVAVLAMIVGIPACFILAHINNTSELTPTDLQSTTVKAQSDQTEKCFFWVLESDTEISRFAPDGEQIQ